MEVQPLPSAVRAARPLVQCVTNVVSVDLMANTLLAAGAAPAMVSSAAEVEDFAKHADCLLVNIGTLDVGDVGAMLAAVDAMTALNKPWVLDPVAVGATPHRTRVAADLALKRPTVIKGNASEVVGLADAVGAAAAVPGAAPRGVDSTLAPKAAVDAAQSLATLLLCVVVVTGEVDYVVSPPADRSGVDCPTLVICGGHALLPAVTATGCSLGALIAAFCAAAAASGDLRDRRGPGGHTRAALAAASAAASFGAAAAIAGRMAAGPGSFRVALTDSLWSLKDSDVQAASVVEV